MNFFIVVNQSPWGDPLATAAAKFALTADAQGHHIVAVFFRQDGIYHASQGAKSDEGLSSPTDDWLALARSGTRLLLCSSAASRRLPDTGSEENNGKFTYAGLAEFWRLSEAADRVVSF